MRKSLLVACGVWCFVLMLGARFVAAAEVDWVRVGTSGKTIIFLFKDAGGDDKAIVKDLNPAVHPQITINGKDAISLDKPIYQKAAAEWDWPIGLPYVIYPLDHTLKATDQVTVSIPDHWVNCVGGAIAGQANRAVENYVGKSLLPPPPEKYTLKLGMNLSMEAWAPIVYRANLMRSTSYFVTTPQHSPLPLGPNGLPTSTEFKPVLNIYCTIPDPGDYTLMWDGKDKLELTNPALHCTTDQLTGGVNNKRVYSKTSANSMVWLNLAFLGPDVRNIRVYPPGTKTDGSQQFNSEFLRMLRGVKSLRLYVNSAIGSNMSTFDEFPKDEQERRLADKVIAAKIIQAEPFDNNPDFFQKNWAFVKFTTDGPHHLKTGYSATVNCPTELTMTTGKKLKLQGAGMVLVLSPTQFAFGFYDTGSTKLETVNQVTPVTGTAEVRIAQGDWWLSESTDLVNAIDGCDLWWNVPALLDDDSCHKMFAVLAKRLAKGRKIHVEYSNEVWNWEYSETNYALGMSHLDPDPTTRGLRNWYTKRSAQVWAIAREEFGKQGREGDVLGVCACQLANLSQSLAYARTHNIAIDEMAVAPYYGIGPGSKWDSAPYVGDATKNLDPDQICDLADMSVQYNNLAERGMNASAAQLKAANYQGKFVTYEGGIESVYFPNMDEKTARLASRGRANHPRSAAWERYYLQHLQDKYGIDLMTYYVLNHGNEDIHSKRELQGAYGVYMRWNQPDGKGDGSDGLFNNLTDLLSDKCVSVKGWALHDWNDHVNADAHNPPARN